MSKLTIADREALGAIRSQIVTQRKRLLELPSGRSIASAITKLDEAEMWLTKHINEG